MNIEENSNKFREILRSTNRNGVDTVIDGLEKLGFFLAPASSKHHLAEAGGLVQHSLNVYCQADAIRTAQIHLDAKMEERLPMDSIIIVSLLHDVCKAEIYKPVQKFRKDEEGRWEKYPGWDFDYSHCPLGHGEKSVIRLLLMGLEMTSDEIAAIRWHMAGWDLSNSREAKENFGKACDLYPLLPVLIAADELATRITEVGDGDN